MVGATLPELSPIGKAAQHLLEAGVPVLLLQRGLKAPIKANADPKKDPDGGWLVLTDPEQVDRIDQHPGSNLGICLAPKFGSPLVVVDLDGAAGWAKAKELGVNSAASVWVARTGTRGHLHVYYYRQGPDAPPQRVIKAGGLPIDLLSDGYSVCPPSDTSREPDGGGPYRWVRGKGPADIPVCELDPPPEALMEWWRSLGAGPTASAWDTPARGGAWELLLGPIPEGRRHDSMVRVAGWLRLYHPKPVGLALLAAINDGRGQPPLPATEIETITDSVWRYPQRGVNGHPLAVVPSFQREVSP